MMWTTKLMVDGVWQGDVVDTPQIAAKRARSARAFRGEVRADGAGPHPSEAGRYHLFVSYACPFAHRVILAHRLKRLDGIVGLSVVHPRWNTSHGWVFGDTPLSTPDRSGEGFTHLHQAFSASKPDYTGRVTVPVLWDKAARRIVSDDSRAILSMLNSAFDRVGGDSTVDLLPRALQPEIAALSDEIASEIAAGVYRVGGAVDQDAYDAAETALFAALDRQETRLADGRAFLHGTSVTESDILLFTPLVRFEAVYAPLFRALRRRLSDYPCLWTWVKRMDSLPGVHETVRFDHILPHYYDGWAPRNSRIVPAWHLARTCEKRRLQMPSLRGLTFWQI